MASLSNTIQQYLEKLLRSQQGAAVEIRRNELAQAFDCSPSQINYVLETRFTTERGYIIESRRGGGGFVRIIQVNCDSRDAVLDLIHEEIGSRVTQDEAFHYVQRLTDSGFVSEREAAIMRAALDRSALSIQLPVRDVIRARLLKGMVLGVLKAEAKSPSQAQGKQEE